MTQKFNMVAKFEWCLVETIQQRQNLLVPNVYTLSHLIDRLEREPFSSSFLQFLKVKLVSVLVVKESFENYEVLRDTLRLCVFFCSRLRVFFGLY